MDQIPTADLLELVLMQRDSIDLQFQFWLTITFAAIAAGHVAGPRLQYGLRTLITGLYVLASLHLALRWTHDGAVGSRWIDELVRRGVDIDIPWIAVYLRTGLMLFGTLSAAVFLMRRPRLERAPATET